MTTKISAGNVELDTLPINILSDVDTVTTAPTSGQSLVWNSTSSKWVPGSLTTAGISEVTNLYYTDARARAAVSVSGSLAYNSSTGVVSYTTPATTGITEGTNLYYTDTRARAAVSVSGSLAYNSSTGVLSYTTPATTSITEGTNLYYTDARVATKIGTTSIDALSDVDTTTTAPTTGQALVWNVSTSKWVPGTISGGGGGSISVSDEGTVLTSTASSVNFTGAGVTATTSGNAVTVTIAGGGGSGGGVIPGTLTVDNFTGTGSQTSFVLTTAPGSKNETVINIDGVIQLREAYSLSGSTIVFSGPPASGAKIEVTVIGESVGSGGTVPGTLTVNSFTGNGSQTAFVLSNTPNSKNETVINIDGVFQLRSDYLLAGATVTFLGAAPVSGAKIEVTIVGASGTGASTITSNTFTANGSQTSFVLATVPNSINETSVNLNGVLQLREAYSLSGATLTFSSVPPSGAKIEVTITTAGSVVINGQSITTRSYTGTGSQVAFTVTSGVKADNVMVVQSGVLQLPIADYTVSGTTLTFLTAPALDDTIHIREFTSVGNSLDNLIINSFLLMGA